MWGFLIGCAIDKGLRVDAYIGERARRHGGRTCLLDRVLLNLTRRFTFDLRWLAYLKWWSADRDGMSR